MKYVRRQIDLRRKVKPNEEIQVTERIKTRLLALGLATNERNASRYARNYVKNKNTIWEKKKIR